MTSCERPGDERLSLADRSVRGPAREALIDRRSQLLIRVRLFNPPDYAGRYDKPDAFSDLRSNDARHLAFELLATAEHTEILTAQDNGSEDAP